MKKNYLILLLTFLSINGFAQVTWEKLYCRISYDDFRCVEEVTAGGGYIVAGYSVISAANDTDAYLVRLNANGDTIWSYSYNGSLSKYDLFYKVINTTDGGFLACGYTRSVTGLSEDILYVKVNSSGQFQWAKTYGGSGIEHAQDLIQTSDGYTIVGYSTSTPAQYYDALIIHTDLNGDILWTKLIGFADQDDANSIKQLPDGGYILGGQSYVGGVGKQFLIRTDVNGNLLWTKQLTSTGSANIESIILVSGGYVFVGSMNPASSDNGCLVRTDTSGNVQWLKMYGGSDQDDFHSVQQTTDGGFIIGGTTSSSGFLQSNMWLFKTDQQGDSSWARIFGGDRHDHGYSAIQTSDGGYIFAGFSSSFAYDHYDDGYVVKVGADGTGTNRLTYITAYSLASPTCSSNNSQVKVVLWNFGNQPVSNIPVTVEISGGINMTFDTVFTGPLAANDNVTITFSPTISTSGVGSLTFYGYSDASNDVYPDNNSFNKTVTLTPCVGIEDIPAKLGYTLYPNPAHDNIVLEFSQKYSKAKLELLNSTGAIVETFVLNNTDGMKRPIDLSSFSKGLYLFKVTTEDGFDVRRVVLE